MSYSSTLNPTQDWWIFSEVWILTSMMKVACKFQILGNVVIYPHLGTTNVKVRSTYQMMCHKIYGVFACRFQIHPHGFWELLSYLERCSVTCEFHANPYLNCEKSANKQTSVTDFMSCFPGLTDTCPKETGGYILCFGVGKLLLFFWVPLSQEKSLVGIKGV